MRRRNPLLVRPPRHLHRLQQESRLTKYGWPAQHLGVHTAEEQRVAAGYAYSAWDKDGRDGYPVVVTLDVRGLDAEPDVDALLWWYERGGKEGAREALEWLEDARVDGDELAEHRLGDHMSEFHERNEQVSTVGEVLLNVEPNWHMIAHHTGKLKPALEGKRPAIRDLLLALFPQRRYLTDFDLDRVMSISTFKPWRDRLVPAWLFDDPDDDSPVAMEVKDAEDGGYEVVSEDDVDRFEPTYLDLYEKTNIGMSEYHGTTAEVIVAAFPDLDLPAPDSDWREFWR
jgi:hypothetical protein